MWSSDLPRFTRRCLLTGSLAGWSLLAPMALAANQAPRVRVWTSERGGAQGEVVEHLRRLWGEKVQLESLTVPPVPLRLPEVQLHLTLGVRPLVELAALLQNQPGMSSAPVLAALLPEAAYASLAPSLPPRSSAVWLDQPPERFLALIQRAMPHRRRVGVLLGPASVALESRLERAASERQLVLVKSRMLEETQNLFPLLRTLLAESDVLLALPDPLIYNPATLQNILIATYRQRVPVVSYAESHVRAGATLSLFTTPQEVARQVAAATQLLWTQGQLPAPAKAASGSVVVNNQVARSLGLNVPDAETLQQALAAGGRR